jgi:tetratricopeptide (TPR) repeat protein
MKRTPLEPIDQMGTGLMATKFRSLRTVFLSGIVVIGAACSPPAPGVRATASQSSPATATAADPEKAWEKANLLGELAYRRGALEEAKKHFQTALQQAKTFKPHDLRLATSLNNQGLVYLGMGDAKEAESLLAQALAIREKTLGTLHRDVARSLSNQGLLYRQQKKFDEAEAVYERARSIFERVSGPESAEAAQCCQSLGLVALARERYVEAEYLLRTAMVAREKIHGPESAEYATTMHHIGVLYHLQAKYPVAEDCFRKALRIREKVFGAVHPALLPTLDYYAELLRKNNRTEEANQLQLRAREIRGKFTQPAVIE